MTSVRLTRFAAAAAAVVLLLTAPAPLAAQVSAAPPGADSVRTAPAPSDSGGGPALRAAVEYQYVHFDTVFDDWQLASASLSARWRPVTAIGRVNYAHRYGDSEWQFEGEAYPRFDGGYAYLSAAYSAGEAFPEWRLGAEVFASLPRAFEVSAGVREMRFTDDAVHIWTGSVGKYAGNWWTSLRPYISKDDDGIAATVVLTTRHYVPDADNYVGLLVSYGSSPVGTTTADEVDRGADLLVRIDGVHSLPGGFGWLWNAHFEREDLNPGTRSRVGLGLGLRRDL